MFFTLHLHLVSSTFSDTGHSILFKFIHCLGNTSDPTVWMDWEEERDSIANHKKRHAIVVKKMVGIMILRSIFHAIMVALILYTGIK